MNRDICSEFSIKYVESESQNETALGYNSLQPQSFSRMMDFNQKEKVSTPILH